MQKFRRFLIRGQEDGFLVHRRSDDGKNPTNAKFGKGTIRLPLKKKVIEIRFYMRHRICIVGLSVRPSITPFRRRENLNFSGSNNTILHEVRVYFRCELASLHEVMSVRPYVCMSVMH